MSDSAKKTTTDTFFDVYKSLEPSRRDQDESLVTLAVGEGVIPASMRYGVMLNIDRGVVKATNGDLYYFQHSGVDTENPIYRIVKADTSTKKWEAERLYNNCKLGCDLVEKAWPLSVSVEAQNDKTVDVDDDKEDEEKAAGPAGHGPAGKPPASVSEAQAIAGQHRQITEVHPGAAAAVTPDRPEVGRDWHGTEKALPEIPQQAQIENPMWRTTDLLRAWGQQLQASAPRQYQVPEQERHFMTEVLGRTPDEISSGQAVMSPTQRAQFNMWLTRSLRTRVSGLQQWLEKSNK